jgi:hypothetical protein
MTETATLKSYRHYKGGTYTLLHVARSSEERETLLAVYVSHQTQAVWVRPWVMFNEPVRWPDGEIRARFSEMAPKRWRLIGHDTLEGADYPLTEHDSEEAAQRAASERMRMLESTQPSRSSGGQDGIQDRVYIERPDGSRFRFGGTP